MVITDATDGGLSCPTERGSLTVHVPQRLGDPVPEHRLDRLYSVFPDELPCPSRPVSRMGFKAIFPYPLGPRHILLPVSALPCSGWGPISLDR